MVVDEREGGANDDTHDQPLYLALEQDGSATRPYSQKRVATLHEAVVEAEAVANAGDVVLLSPGGTSFDEFKDFEERGEKYRLWVQQLS